MNSGTPFREFAELCGLLERTSSRFEKVRHIASFLRKLRREEIMPAVLFLTGKPFQEAEEKALEVGGHTLWSVFRAPPQRILSHEPLTILKVKEYFDRIAQERGAGSRLRKRRLLEGLLNMAEPPEAEYIMRIISGEMRIGVVEGLALDAIAKAANAYPDLVRRCYMLLGDIGKVAVIALSEGEAGLRRVGVQLFSPIRPMLAEMSYDVKEVLKEHGGRTAFEFKYDGARVQVHKKGDRVKVFSRRLSDVTKSIPDLVQLLSNVIKANEALVEGEVVGIGEGGRPLPFQDLMRRMRRIQNVESMARELPLMVYLFDIIYLDGKTLIDLPYSVRWDMLAKAVGDEKYLAERIVTDSPAEAISFMKKALESGHEGLMAKALNSDYSPGTRGKKWFKIKPAETLDAVIIAAEWGHGRRRGWLSNYHLAVLDEDSGNFVMVGKTFKGLTDEEFKAMTERLLSIKVAEDEFTVYVKPQIVVEVAYNEIQASPHYESGFALRFARITKIRDDKGASDADTLGTLKRLYQRQFEHKGARLGC